MKVRDLVLAVAAGLVVAPSVFAQTVQGPLGATSTGNVEVTMTVTDSVEITDLQTLALGTFGGANTGDQNAEDAYCVYANGGDAYSIDVTSTNTAATDDSNKFFLLGATDADQIMYTVKLGGRLVTNSTTVTAASAESVINYGGTSSTFYGEKTRNCAGSTNAGIRVDIAEQEIRDASSGTYADTIILIVNPV
ncbi:MAG: hypothetical protein ACI9VI_001673 [Candidatus Azotimanducaceae bacterium]|jgi:hypothetical protein